MTALQTIKRIMQITYYLKKFMLSRNKLFYLVFALMTLVLVLTGCGSSTGNGKSEDNKAKESEGNTDYASAVKENPIVTITMNNDEKIVIELQPSTAPNTQKHFQK